MSTVTTCDRYTRPNSIRGIDFLATMPRRFVKLVQGDLVMFDSPLDTRTKVNMNWTAAAGRSP